MASSRLFLVIAGAAGWIWCIGTATAQQPATPAGSGAPAAAASPAGFRWDDIVIQWNERRYKIEATGFTARDESGVDWGSDEVMVETTDADGWTVTDEI